MEIIPLSRCAVYDSRNSKFVKEKGASRLLSHLGIKTSLSKISLFGDIFF